MPGDTINFFNKIIMAWYEYLPGVKLVQGIGNAAQKIGDWLGGVWKDYTGQTAIEMQNQANLDMAKYQTEMEEELYKKWRSPAAIMRQYDEAGLNRNLIYGSASAGIGASPHFDAPHVERNMSGSEKVNTALSALSQVFSIGQGIYNMAAAKEIAQQSAIKTMDDDVKYRSNALDYILKSDMLGGDVGTRRRIPFVHTDLYSRYLGEYRASKFNDFLRKGMLNIYDFGGSADTNGNLKLSDMKTPSYYLTRNQLNSLKYQLQHEIGNWGTYGKMFMSLLDILK